MDKKFFARAPNSSMWLGQDAEGSWRAFQEFAKAWAFDGQEQASAAWDEACGSCLLRCADTGEAVPAWASSRPVFLRGRVPEVMPGRFDLYLALIDGRFVREIQGKLSLTADEGQAKVFGGLLEAQGAIAALRTAKCKCLAVLPLACRSGEPIAVEGAQLDPLAAASYAKSLREEWSELVPPARESSGKSKSI